MKHPDDTRPDATLEDATLEDASLKDAVDAVRDDAPDSEAVRRAADRVWARLAAGASAPAVPSAEAGTDADADAGTIAGCADYQALIPAWLAGELPAARRLLLEDHSRECVTCRRALIAARSGETARDGAEAAADEAAGAAPRRWLLAAAVLVAVLAAGAVLWFAPLGGTAATVASVDGGLLAVAEAGPAVTPLAGGAEISAGAPVRTAEGSSAVLTLEDGSRIEMADRTQIRVRRARRGTTVHVDRGSIIVEAADQRPRHLYAATREALVSVTGTIFAVQHGVKGSRVSVVEGEVRVRRGRDEVVLHPGMQVTSRASLAETTVAHEVAWSRNVDRYLELLSELSALRKEIARRVEPAELRFASDLVHRVPADTRVYAALPNLSGNLAEGYQVFRERLATSPVLASWWADVGPDRQAELDGIIARLRDFGSYLGPEIVVTLNGTAETVDHGGPLVLATVERPADFRVYLEQELDRLAGETEELPVTVVDDPASAEPNGTMLLWIGDDLLAASHDADLLRAAAAGAGGFQASELGQAVHAAYADGTQWLVAVELETFLAGAMSDEESLRAAGFADLDRLLVERWDEGERAVMAAELTFAGPRRGIASWLAAPAPMGSLEFVSADAHLAAAFVVEDPLLLLDDLLSLEPGEEVDFSALERELGLSVRDDLAAPLGGEAAFALDGPFLPDPSWKVIVEVYDPGTLQHSLETAVTEADGRLRAEGQPGVTLASEKAGGRTWYRLETPLRSVHYLYADGYMVLAPSRALLERTLDQRASGATLTTSERFRNLLPRDGRADFSALFFQHLGPLLAPLAGATGGLEGGALTPEQSRALARLAADAEPTLAYAYGEEDRILVAGTGPGGPLGFGLHALTGVDGLTGLGYALSAAAEQAEATGKE